MLFRSTKGKLERFNENVTGGDGSYLAVVPPGPNLLSDGIVATPIVGGEPRAEGEFGDGEAGAGGGGFEFGIDPSTDPELAMVLRMSMEEEENRLARERREREAQEASRMEAIPEEGGAAAANGEGEAKPHQPTVEDEKKDADGDDRMDNA